MFFALCIATIAPFTLVAGALAVIVYVEACSQIQRVLLTRTIRSSRQEMSMDELFLTIRDRRD